MAKIRREPVKGSSDQIRELLERNLTKAMEASRELDEVHAAYIAGQIDGMLNKRLLDGRQSA